MTEPLSDFERMLLTPDPTTTAVQPRQAGGFFWPAETHQPAPAVTQTTALTNDARDQRYQQLQAQGELERNQPHWRVWLAEKLSQHPDVKTQWLSLFICQVDMETLEFMDNDPEAVFARYRKVYPVDQKLAEKLAKEQEAKDKATAYQVLSERRAAAHETFTAAWQAYISACGARRARFAEAELAASEAKIAARKNRDFEVAQAEENYKHEMTRVSAQLKQVLAEPAPVQPVKPKG